MTVAEHDLDCVPRIDVAVVSTFADGTILASPDVVSPPADPCVVPSVSAFVRSEDLENPTFRTAGRLFQLQLDCHWASESCLRDGVSIACLNPQLVPILFLELDSASMWCPGRISFKLQWWCL
jgi:hypothetical protein